MTNKEIKKYRQKFSKIKNEVNITEKEPLNERLRILVEGIKKAQKLADDICAIKYLGTDLKLMEGFYASQKLSPVSEDQFRDKISIAEEIYQELCRSVYIELQTEEMFNACVSAKHSCFWAAIAAIAACISIFSALWLS